MSLEMKYFVLSPESKDYEHAVASRAAMRAYAEAIRPFDVQRAEDILTWVSVAQLKEFERGRQIPPGTYTATIIKAEARGKTLSMTMELDLP